MSHGPGQTHLSASDKLADKDSLCAKYKIFAFIDHGFNN